MKDVYEVPAHKYGFAGFMNNIAGNPDKDGNITSGLFKGMSGNVASGLGALGSAVGGVAGGLIGGGRTSPAGDLIGGLGKIAGAIPGPWGAIAGAGLGVISGLTNAAFGVKLNQENINAVNNNIGAMNNFQSNASSFDQLAQNINSQPTAMRFDQSFVGKNGWFNKGATKKFNQLQAQQDMAQQFVNNSLDNNMNNLINTQSQNLLANYAAKGGPLATQGSDWSTGLNYIGAGGSHEQNPNGGIQQGVAPDGLPNLVEEGEVIWNGDYVFSKRLKVPKATRNKYKLRGTKPMSFADAALEFNKEMEERPNDPISKRGRDGMLAKLADVQEEKRAKIAAKEQAQQSALMGMMGMPQDQMAMQKQPTGDDIMSGANQEELARQEIMQDMQQPMVEGYAAKGGPIGHKFEIAGPKPNVSNDAADLFRLYWTGLDERLSKDRSSILDWDNIPWTLSKKDTDVWNKTIAELKKKYADLSKSDASQKKAEDLIAIANRGKEGPISRTINNMYNAYVGNLNNTANKDYKVSEYYPTQLGTSNYWPDETFFMGDNFYNSVETPKTGLEAAKERWSSYTGGGVPTGLEMLDYKPSVVNTPIENNGVIDITPQGSNESLQKAAGNKGKNKTSNIGYPWQGYLRYAPAIGSAIGVFSDLMGWTNKPDYSAADALLNATSGVKDVSFNPIGDYAQYRPVDTRFALNTLNGAAGATRRGIMNTSAGNRGTAMAGMLAADNNYMNSIGNTLFTAENTNYDRYLKALAHNADINKFNSEGFLKAAMANQGAGEVRAKYAAMAADARQRALALASANRSANLTNLFDNLGNIGIDALNRADARWLAQFWKGANTPSISVKHGGRIKKRRRGRVI